MPCSENVIGKLSLRVVLYNVDIETRTKDNVFVTISLAVRVKVAESNEEFPKPREVPKRQQRVKPKRDEKEKVTLLDDNLDGDDDEIELIAAPIQPDPIFTAKKKLNPDLIYKAYYKLSDPISQKNVH